MEVKGKEEEQLHLPMIIAVKGHPSSGRSKVARELANYLNYTLIDHHDIAPILEKSTLRPSSSAESKDLDDLSFEILHKMALTQLRLEIEVVLSAPFSNQTHFNKLLDLVLSYPNGTLIDCRSQGEDQQHAADLDDRSVRKLTVDPTNPFFLEDLVSVIFPAKTVRHLHELLVFRETKNEQKPSCKSGGKIISGPSYQCVECDEYSFHKSCAESPDNLQICPAYLTGKQPEYGEFPEKHRCKICEASNLTTFYDCHDCLFETNMKCKVLPVILRHEMHPHPLNLIIMPISYDYEYGCCGCGDLGKSISYRCYDCNFNLHVSCISLTRAVNSRFHEHPLVLSSQFRGDYGRENPVCGICKELRDPTHWVYVCENCNFAAHILCARNQSRAS